METGTKVILGVGEITEMAVFGQGKAWIHLACSGACGRENAGFPGVLSVKR